MIWPYVDAVLTRIRPYRERLALCLDGAMVLVSWQITYLFRLGFERWFSARPSYDHLVAAGLVVLYMLTLLLVRVPKGMWRFSGFGEIKRIIGACGVAGSLGATAILMAQLVQIPRSVLALHPVFCMIGMAMMRLGYRTLYEHMRSRINGSTTDHRRALVLGAGQAGRLLVAGIQHQGWVVVGWLDDDAAMQDSRIAGIPVLGRLSDLPRVASVHGVTHVIVAIPSATAQQRRATLDLAASTGLHVLTVPSSAELRSGSSVNQLRDIEPEDLLGRTPVQLDEAGISEAIGGRAVLITGAGGSIGSELCRQVAQFGPSQLILLELSEYALYKVEQELTERFPYLPLVRLIGDVKDLAQLRRILMKYRPGFVFHAAAYKHVPLMEQHNAAVAVMNNALGTYNVAHAAAEAGVQYFVMVSTDKAVNPTNVMGASKRVAELVVGHMARLGYDTRFMVVRFGNVLGSSGSVIPKFKEQIARGGPVTLTHPDITRYFMTIPEAARLVIQAGAIGESGRVYVLDMGEPVKIIDLARDMIRLAGKSLDEVPIKITGLRPGEKLYEELLAASDTTIPTAIARLRVAVLDDAVMAARAFDWVRSLPEQQDSWDDEVVRRALQQLVPEYRPPLAG